jgi:hypothetical protein
MERRIRQLFDKIENEVLLCISVNFSRCMYMNGQTTWRDFESSQDVEEGNINEKLDLFDCKLRIWFD